MVKDLGLKLNCMAIGSLPHKDVNKAMDIVEKNFKIPFWPQLAKLNKNEDMILQFLQGLPGLVCDPEKIFIDNESDLFFEQLEEFFIDYEEIIADSNSELIQKYAVTKENSATFKPFINIIKDNKPNFAKGQICGPFTLATSLTDKSGRSIYYDETLREIIVKLLSLKVLWQIRAIKKASPDTTPIIFIDEPSISQLGTSAFITISRDDVIQIIKEISDLIKANGALSAIHCCGKCDWTVPIDCEVNIINLDGYFFAQNLSLFSNELKPFLSNGGIIAWGIIPTLDKKALESSNISIMIERFEQAINFLVQKGIDKELILNQSMITPSCGAGSLTIELSEKAMNLTKELSDELTKRYKT